MISAIIAQKGGKDKLVKQHNLCYITYIHAYGG